MTPNADSGFDTSDPSGVSPKTAAKPTGRSLDHVCAEQVNPSGAAPLFVEIGGVSGTTSNTIRISCVGQRRMRPFPGVTYADALYNTLTGLFGGDPDAECGHVQGRARQEHHRLRPRGPEPVQGAQDEQRRPEAGQRLDGAARTTRRRHGRRGRAVHDGHGHQPDRLNLTSTRLTEASATGTRIDIDKTVKAFMDLSVLTAMCDNNRVIFLKMPGQLHLRNLRPRP